MDPGAMTSARGGRVAVDTGGTFTDVVAADGRVAKLPSTPADPALAVAEGVEAVGGAASLAHGTTVATNALLERRGGRVALVVTEGQRDLIEIARQARPSLYDQWADRPEPLVERDLRLEIAGRLNASGEEVAPLGSLPPIPKGVDAVAVCLLHSDRNDAHERAVAKLVRGVPVVCSCEVSSEFREYERAVTTTANAYLLAACRDYLRSIEALAPEVLVLTSAGGLRPVSEATEIPASLLLSGPAGGVLAASEAAEAAGWPDCISFDMGGTSTDVCLIRDGKPEPAAERTVADLPIRMPSLDVHTIGAGGGSIARIDPGGALAVGPQSAGADPGPACYGRGGTQPTVTDADLVLGRIPPDGFAALGRLDTKAARSALAGRSKIDAQGVVDVVDSNMVQALRVVSVERGVDPEQLALVAFGGAGPLHACALAEALNMPAVIVPPRAGVLSAVGILAAPRQVDLVRSWLTPADLTGIEEALAELGEQARARAEKGDSSRDVVVQTAVDCRYRGQSHELTVARPEDFAAEHERRNGFTMSDLPVEVTALRATARRLSGIDVAELPPPDRSGTKRGPAVIAEPDCTIWVAEGWTAKVHESGSWIITRKERKP